jgi:hypothetical protein
VGIVCPADSLAFAHRVGTTGFARLPAPGGLNPTAAACNGQEVIAGSAALTPPDPQTANGPCHAAIRLPIPA